MDNFFSSCPLCGSENKTGGKFCGVCGGDLKVFAKSPEAQGERFCTRCGAANKFSTKFCTKCGNSLQAKTPSTDNNYNSYESLQPVKSDFIIEESPNQGETQTLVDFPGEVNTAQSNTKSVYKAADEESSHSAEKKKQDNKVSKKWYVAIIAVIASIAVIIGGMFIVFSDSLPFASKKPAGSLDEALESDENSEVCAINTKTITQVLRNYYKSTYPEEICDLNGVIIITSNGENAVDIKITGETKGLDVEKFGSFFKNAPFCPSKGTYVITLTGSADEDKYINIECICGDYINHTKIGD